jgi:uncharacterized protein
MPKFEWRAEKSKRNWHKHGLALDLAVEFDLSNALVIIDDSEDYGEERCVAIGFIGANLHTMVYVEQGDKIRVISLRRSTKKETKDYVKTLR